MNATTKVAVVTGAGGGMGYNIARDLRARAANVALLDVKPPPDGLAPLGEHAVYIECDLSDEHSVASAFEQIDARFGDRLDWLVNAAGVLWFDRDKSALDIDLDIWDRVLTINLKSV